MSLPAKGGLFFMQYLLMSVVCKENFVYLRCQVPYSAWHDI